MRTLIILGAFAFANAAYAQPQNVEPTPPVTAKEDTGPKKQTTGQVMGDIATQPLQDLNVKNKRIPELLILARGNPYGTDGTRTCATISRDIAALSSVLGADIDAPPQGRPSRGRQAANVGRGIVQGLIPFRGVIREVSGAAGAQREWDSAVDAGIARRGFLRGIAKSRGCRVAS